MLTANISKTTPSELFDGYFHCRMELQCASVLYLVEFLCAFAGPVNKYLVQIKLHYLFVNWGLVNRLTRLRQKPEHWTRYFGPGSKCSFLPVRFKHLFLPTPTPKRILHGSVSGSD